MAIDHQTQELGDAGARQEPSPLQGKIRAIRILAFVLVPAAFIGLITFGLLRTAPPAELQNKTAPDFSLPLLGGGQLSSDSLRGKPLVINFWASWCQPCKEEAPLLEKQWQKYRDRGITVVGVNVQDSTEAAAEFAREYGLTFPLVRDVDLVLYRKLGVRGMPETFFIDHTYKFTAVGSGPHVGQQGGTKVLGALKPAILESQMEQLWEKMGREPAEGPPDPGVGHQ